MAMNSSPVFLGSRIAGLATHLRCPECRASGSLQRETDALRCGQCDAVFAVRNGVPDLLNALSAAARVQELKSDTGSAMVEEYAGVGEAESTGGSGTVLSRILRWLRPPSVLYHPDPEMRSADADRLFSHAGAQTAVLNVGGGPRRYRHEVALNLDAFVNVDLLGDAHNIPFADNSFDSVMCNAVLEHVYSPEQVVAEMIRVLRPGGYLYAEVPFIFFFHGYPNDFRRYTREGMRYLFRGLDDVKIELSGGPVSAWLQSGNAVMQMFLPRRPVLVRKLFNGVYRWLLFPLKYLDIPLARHHPDAHLLAVGFSVFGRKPAEGDRS